MISRPTEREILDRIASRIKTETPLTANLDSSLIGVILKIIAAEMNQVWGWVEELDKQANLSTASAAGLDSWGQLLGVTRRVAQSANSLGMSRAVRLTNLGSTPVTIPANIRVWKSRDPQIAYFTTEGTTLSAGQSVEVHAVAVNNGEIYNVAIGELDSHNIPNATVRVTNILPIENGSFTESDSSYRQRLQQEFTRRQVLNTSNVDALIRSVPGVRDAFLLEYKRGAGTFDVVVIPYNYSATSNIVDECNTVLAQNIPAGISARARGPQYRQLDVRVNLNFMPDTGTRKESIRESVRSQIIARIDNLPVENGTGNGTFYVAQLQALATLSNNEVTSSIVTLGLDGSPISNYGEIRLGIGERIVLRSLSVE